MPRQAFKCGKRRQELNQRDSAYLLSLKRLFSLFNDTSYRHWPQVGTHKHAPVDLRTSQSGEGGIFSLEILFFFDDSSLNQVE